MNEILDLSNNNGSNHDFAKVFESGQRRVIFKVTQGSSFVDRVTPGLARQANKAGLRCGGYHFSDHYDQLPREQAHFFVEHLTSVETKIVPVLDLEIGTPSKALGRWAIEFLAEVKKQTGQQPLIYSYADFLARCQFTTPPAPLWLAAFGRNDGVEHTFFTPSPWKGPFVTGRKGIFLKIQNLRTPPIGRVVAHQYASKAHVRGISGEVDVSHIFDFKAVDASALSRAIGGSLLSGV